MSEEYSLLSPFIQKYIYEHGWKELRDIQSRAIKVILKSDYHLLIASGTASGKTEAAFFPALTILDKNPSSSVGILYVGPLKALINDQFERLNDLLRESEIPLWHWHGDVSASEKKRALKNPSGVMQITPESLESLLMRHTTDILKLFSDLRFVIIDEVHTFMGQERGSQLLCQLKRIEELAHCHPRRIGLSATINDYQMAKAWLRSGTDREVSLAKSAAKKEKEVRVNYYNIPVIDNKDEALFFSEKGYEIYSHLYDTVYDTNSIVFTNSRSSAEIVNRCLQKIANVRKTDESQFQVHHGSLSAALRGEVETTLRNKFTKSVVSATTTLELGLDIGELDKVVQMGPPYSVSSYVQRLGRSGRRGKSSKMEFYCSEGKGAKRSIPDLIPWELLQTIASIELYDESGWIEPFVTRKKPFSLLYHQTMSVLYSSEGMKPGKLANIILSLPAFGSITKDEYKLFLRYLIQTGQLEKTADGLLLIGVKAEKKVNYYGFLSVFEEKQEYRVMEGTKEIGTIENFDVGYPYLTLGGKFWKIIDVSKERKVITVEPSDGTGLIRYWSGGVGSVHTAVVKKMREILLSDKEYPYLNEEGISRLRIARGLAKQYDLCNCLVLGQNDTFYILPWIGSLEFETLYREITHHIIPKYSLGFGRSGNRFLSVKGNITAEELIGELYSLRQNHCDPKSLIDNLEDPYNGKYSYFVPHDLRIIELMEDGLRQDFEYL